MTHYLAETTVILKLINQIGPCGDLNISPRIYLLAWRVVDRAERRGDESSWWWISNYFGVSD